MAKIKVDIILILLVLPILFISVFFPVKITNHAKLSEVKLGLPFNFIVQNQSHYDPPFPWTTRFLSIWENPTQILWPQFFLSFLIIFLAVFLVLRSLGLSEKKIKNLTP